VRISIGEVQSTVLKAARGCYMSWGMAEEAARSAAWLETRGLPAALVASRLVGENDAIPMARLRPVDPFAEEIKGEGRLCPVLTGAAICDANRDQAFSISAVAHPLLLVSFIAQLGEGQECDFNITWHGVEIICGANGLTVKGSKADLTKGHASTINIVRSTEDARVVEHRELRADVDDSALELLNHYAHRTYVPASEASRLAGAGAGLTDND
jgi:hypothetical protein